MTETAPRWLEQLLRLLLRPHDRDTVMAHLREEYRASVPATRGRFQAQLWYLGQALGPVDSIRLGLVLGVLFGLWNLIASLFDPLAEDTPLTLLKFYGPMFTVWGVAGFSAARRTGRILSGVRAGSTVAFVTFVVFSLAVMARVNLFFDVTSHRPDWQNLVARYQASGFASLRAYANYVYLSGAPFKIMVASSIGAATGFVGGLCGSLGRRERAPMSAHGA